MRQRRRYQKFLFNWAGRQYVFDWNSISNNYYLSKADTMNDSHSPTLRTACDAWIKSNHFAGMTAAEFLEKTVGVTNVIWLKRPTDRS